MISHNLPRWHASKRPQWGTCLAEENDVAFQERDGAVPGVEGLPQVLDEFTGDLGLRLTQ